LRTQVTTYLLSNYSFNNQEHDDEIFGDGNAISFDARILDPRLGRWLSIDPLFKSYASHSPYCSFANNPVFWQDSKGEKLVLGGDREKALEDIRSLVPARYQPFVKATSAGEVYIDYPLGEAGGELYKDEFALTEDSKGANLISNLITASENYLYSNGGNDGQYQFTDRKTGEQDEANITKAGEGIENLSKTAYIFGKDGDPSSYTNIDDKLPAEGFDGQVVIDKNATWNEGKGEPNKQGVYPIDNKPKSRSSVVFHELSENYYRTTGKLPYKFVNYYQGAPDWRSFESAKKGGYREKSTKIDQGAHGKATADETNARTGDPVKSSVPGVGSKNK